MERKTKSLLSIYSNHPFIAFLIKNNMEDKQLGWTGWDKAGASQINVCLLHPGMPRPKGIKVSCCFFSGGEVFFLRCFSTLVVFLRLQHYLFNKPFQFDSNKCLRVSFVASKKLIFPPLLLLLKDVFIFSSSYSFRKTAVVAVTVAVGEGQRKVPPCPRLFLFARVFV